MDVERQKGLAAVTSYSDPTEDGFQIRNYSKLGGTEVDDQEMRMLGRTQQLNVCS